MKNLLIRGTIILTLAGIATRIIGFLYRILLAGALGETGLGIYQLIFPVYGICFTLYAAGIQTAVSGMISYEPSGKHAGILKTGLLLSLMVSCSLSVLLWHFADPVGTCFLGTAQTTPLLRILCVIFPFCGVTSVINGYFYGIGNAKTPAISQILEQLFRVFFVCATGFLLYHGMLSGELAVWGLVCGELAANLYNISRLLHHIRLRILVKSLCCFSSLLKLSLPLIGSKLILSVLGSLESVLIPVMLCSYGYEKEDAFGIYGVLSGIVMPFLLFPGTITNSLSVLLLPEISHAAGSKNHEKVQQTTTTTLHYSFLLGILTTGIFLVFGRPLGECLFHSENAGKLLTLLALICPFLYCTTTLSSVINGLGKTGTTFFHNICGLSVRIVCLVFLTPRFGICGYLLGLVSGQIIIYLMHAFYLCRKKHLPALFSHHLIAPFVFSLSTLIAVRKSAERFLYFLPVFWVEMGALAAACLVILFYLLKTGQIHLSDFKH